MNDSDTRRPKTPLIIEFHVAFGKGVSALEAMSLLASNRLWVLEGIHPFKLEGQS